MSTDQICAYCEHPRLLHLDGVKSCCAYSGEPVKACSCPRFIPNTNTETHEVTAQVLAEDATRELKIEDTANAGIAEREYAKAIEGRAPPDFAAWGGSHCPTDIIPGAPAVPTIPSERGQSRATKLSILVFDCVDQAIQAARAGRVEDAEEWRDLAKQVDEL